MSKRLPPSLAAVSNAPSLGRLVWLLEFLCCYAGGVDVGTGFSVDREVAVVIEEHGAVLESTPSSDDDDDDSFFDLEAPGRLVEPEVPARERSLDLGFVRSAGEQESAGGAARLGAADGEIPTARGASASPSPSLAEEAPPLRPCNGSKHEMQAADCLCAGMRCKNGSFCVRVLQRPGEPRCVEVAERCEASKLSRTPCWCSSRLACFPGEVCRNSSFDMRYYDGKLLWLMRHQRTHALVRDPYWQNTSRCSTVVLRCRNLATFYPPEECRCGLRAVCHPHNRYCREEANDGEGECFSL
eukprot:TRINITY_DN19705_c0_g1_i1.p1 TRINITY_DN19705_c0_g1~~TRINITY_DN19705_c0_g1_i1.p1  ORF type:complete len:299 (+),score=47.70 TRINITY_DN19705_c0_g1_i1:103-999(+)